MGEITEGDVLFSIPFGAFFTSNVNGTALDPIYEKHSDILSSQYDKLLLKLLLERTNTDTSKYAPYLNHQSYSVKESLLWSDDNFEVPSLQEVIKKQRKAVIDHYTLLNREIFTEYDIFDSVTLEDFQITSYLTLSNHFGMHLGGDLSFLFVPFADLFHSDRDSATWRYALFLPDCFLSVLLILYEYISGTTNLRIPGSPPRYANTKNANKFL